MKFESRIEMLAERWRS